MFSLDSTWRASRDRAIIDRGLALARRATRGGVRFRPARDLQPMFRVGAVLSMTFLAAMNLPTELAAAERLVRAEHGLVVSVSQAASETGRDILAQGGTAVDAAVATALVLAVTYPEAGNIGGGGFMLVYPGGERPVECIDYRETAPGHATADMFVGDTNRLGHKVVGVPGTIRGLALAHARFGKLPWKELVAPAARLAGDGFAIDAAVAKLIESVLAEGGDFAELARVYGKPDHTPWQAGDRFVQPELAQTLRTLGRRRTRRVLSRPNRRANRGRDASRRRTDHGRRSGRLSRPSRVRPCMAPFAATTSMVRRLPARAESRWSKCSTCSKRSIWLGWAAGRRPPNT